MPNPPGIAARDITLIVSVDTEEDNWRPSRNGVTADNVRQLPRLARFLHGLGVRATYFTTYQVAVQPWAADILREIRDAEQAEIGAHLHPWNTPPMDEAFLPRNTMLKNLSPELQRAKLEGLTATLGEVLGSPPTAFRAGRYGFGPDTATALIRCHYRIDSSVTPFVSWHEVDDGPNFVGAPANIYRLAGGVDVRVPQPDGPLLEVPLSCGYSRSPFAFWGRLRRLLEAPAVRPLHLAGIASRAGVVRRIMLSPEICSVADMLALSRLLIDRGLRHLHLSWHSPSLHPGLSPFVGTTAELNRFYSAIESYIEGLTSMACVTFATISEAAATLAPEPCS